MRELLKNIKNDGMLRQSILINMIICGCMAFFYVDSGKMIEPLLYAIFFLCYVISALIFGRKCIPIMYIIFVAGAVQDTTFINCTSFFILVFICLALSAYFNVLYVSSKIKISLLILLLLLPGNKEIIILENAGDIFYSEHG